MKDYFDAIADHVMESVEPEEVVLCAYRGEDSDFVRFNRARVRQAGNVRQRAVSIDYIRGGQHAGGRLELCGELEHDQAALDELASDLRVQRNELPEDPFLMYATEGEDTCDRHDCELPSGTTVANEITAASGNLDLVGIYAAGAVASGFANSLGQRNWYQGASFNLDWSCYHEADKAVKCNYAGTVWSNRHLRESLDDVRERLAVLSKPAKTVRPGRYRTYLAPAAMQELLGIVGWGGFGLKSHRTRQTPLLRMVLDGQTLHPSVTLRERIDPAMTPRFTDRGFLKAENVTLIEAGQYRDCLVDARSGKEYDEPLNAGSEYPNALDLAPGKQPMAEVLEALDTGIYVSNLWYCNFSDRKECRITGMTRFACFWVEDGELRAPLNVMRFDESLYHILGDGLLGLTQERELMMESGTYGGRSTASMNLPGALVEGFRLTL